MISKQRNRGEGDGKKEDGTMKHRFVKALIATIVKIASNDDGGARFGIFREERLWVLGK